MLRCDTHAAYPPTRSGARVPSPQQPHCSGQSPRCRRWSGRRPRPTRRRRAVATPPRPRALRSIPLRCAPAPRPTPRPGIAPRFHAAAAAAATATPNPHTSPARTARSIPTPADLSPPRRSSYEFVSAPSHKINSVDYPPKSWLPNTWHVSTDHHALTLRPHQRPTHAAHTRTTARPFGRSCAPVQRAR